MIECVITYPCVKIVSELITPTHKQKYFERHAWPSPGQLRLAIPHLLSSKLLPQPPTQLHCAN